MSDTREAILDCAEMMLARKGYAGFSAREVAASVEIKPASLYYHFPSKAGLVRAVVERYASCFMAALMKGEGSSGTPGMELARYIALFRQRLTDHLAMCPVFTLFTSPAKVPDEVVSVARDFVDQNIGWLEGVFSRAHAEHPRASALHLLTVMEGALTLASAMRDPSMLDAITRDSGRFLTGVPGKVEVPR